MKVKTPLWTRKCEMKKNDLEAMMRRKGEIQARRHKTLQGRNTAKQNKQNNKQFRGI